MATKIEKTADDRLVMPLNFENVTKARGLFDAVALLCALFNSRKRFPAVSEALLSALRAVGTLIIANDPDMRGVMKLLDSDARENEKLNDAPSFLKPAKARPRKLKKPVKRKKVVRRRTTERARGVRLPRLQAPRG